MLLQWGRLWTGAVGSWRTGIILAWGIREVTPVQGAEGTVDRGAKESRSILLTLHGPTSDSNLQGTRVGTGSTELGWGIQDITEDPSPNLKLDNPTASSSSINSELNQVGSILVLWSILYLEWIPSFHYVLLCVSF